MNHKSINLLVPILILIFTRNSLSFKWPQYLGDYVSDEEYARRDFCLTKVCLRDTDRLIKAAALNASTDPCTDFKNFAAGEFFAHRVPNDRYSFIGFNNDVYRNFYEKMRVVLKQKNKPDEPEMFKVIKQYFAKCTNTDYVRATAVNEIISLLNHHGGSPMTLNSAWSSKNYDVKLSFELDPKVAQITFLSHDLSHCRDPRNNSNEILCFKFYDDSLVNQVILSDESLRFLKPLKLTEDSKRGAFKNVDTFRSLKMPILVRLKNESRAKVFKIRDLAAWSQPLNLNWLKIINDQVLPDVQVTEDDEILVDKEELMRELIMLLATSEAGMVADDFTVVFLFFYQQVFNVYQLAWWDKNYYGIKRSYQRFEECISHLQVNMYPVLQSLLARKYYNATIQDAAREFALEAVTNYIDKFKTLEEINEVVMKKIIEKLSTVKLLVMFPDDVLNQTKVEKFYEHVKFNETQSFVAMWFEISKIRQQLDGARSTHPLKLLNDILRQFQAFYHFDRNILNIPMIFTLYPSFHPERPRFFNLAAFYSDLIQRLNDELEDYVNKNKSPGQPDRSLISSSNLAYDNYDQWLLKGGKDLELTAFKLTSRQMLWLAIAHVHASKGHNRKAVGLNPKNNLDQKYFSLKYRFFPNFLRDFNCGNLTEADEMLADKYIAELNALG